MYRVRGDPRKRRLTLDHYPALTLADARQRAQEVLLAASRGQDHAADKQAHNNSATFAELAHAYLDKHARAKKRSWAEDGRVIGREPIPRWGRRKAADIQRTDVLHLLDAIVDRGSPIQANRTLALVRKMFNWGIGRGLVETNPCVQIEAPGRTNGSGFCPKTKSGLCGRPLAKSVPMMGPMFKLRLLTAQRGGEVASMRWQDIDLDARSWTIPPEASKNGLAHMVPLSDAVIDLLRELRRISGGSEWVFPSPRPGQHVQNV